MLIVRYKADGDFIIRNSLGNAGFAFGSAVYAGAAFTEALTIDV